MQISQSIHKQKSVMFRRDKEPRRLLIDRSSFHNLLRELNGYDAMDFQCNKRVFGLEILFVSVPYTNELTIVEVI